VVRNLSGAANKLYYNRKFEFVKRKFQKISANFETPSETRILAAICAAEKLPVPPGTPVR
jgi:hypothetical protein